MLTRRRRVFEIAISIALAGIFVLSVPPIVGQSSATTASCSVVSGTSGSSCPTTVSVTILVPVNQQGQSMAEVALSGMDYSNGSILPPLVPGIEYRFSAVNIMTDYSFGQWYASSGIVSNPSGSITNISIICKVVYPSPNCAPVTITIYLIKLGNSFFSGYLGQSRSVSEINATFQLPSLVSEWSHEGGSTSKREVVDWGVGIGGINNPSALTVGIQIVETEKSSGYSTQTYQPFWSTTLNGSAQTNFTVNSNQIFPGDEISAKIVKSSPSRCPLPFELFLFDMTYHGGTNWTAYACVNGPLSASTGEWMAWDPLVYSGVFAPQYSQGSFSGLTLDGASFEGLVPMVSATQWVNAGSGWNESLNPGAMIQLPISMGLYPQSFQPYVSTVVNVAVAVFPYNASNSSNPLHILIDGHNYYNGDEAKLTLGATYSIAYSGTYKIGHAFLVEFTQWGTNAGSLGSASSNRTTLNITGSGILEALMSAFNTAWAGYVSAANNRTTTSASGDFVIPATHYQASKLVPPETVGFWVGLGGDNNVTLNGNTGSLWQAGIQIQYVNNSSVASIVPWHEFVSVQHAGAIHYDPNPFLVTQGNVIKVTVSISGGPSCLNQDCWSIENLNNSQNWSGAIFAYPIDTSTVEWIVEDPGGGTIEPPLFQTINFTLLAVDQKAVSMLGPFQREVALGVGTGEEFMPITVSSNRSGFGVNEVDQ